MCLECFVRVLGEVSFGCQIRDIYQIYNTPGHFRIDPSEILGCDWLVMFAAS